MGLGTVNKVLRSISVISLFNIFNILLTMIIFK